MKIRDMLEILDAELLSPDADVDREVHTACGSDMMSDVLAYVKDQAVLLTGLNNPQVVRTADMMDMVCIVFVRGKTPRSAAAGPGGPAGHRGAAHPPHHVPGLRAALCPGPAGR